jgi:hypothetical protein
MILAFTVMLINLHKCVEVKKLIYINKQIGSKSQGNCEEQKLPNVNTILP